MSVTTNSYDHLDRLILKQVQSQLNNTNSRTVYVYNNDNTVQLEVYEMKDDMPEQQIASGILFLDNNGDTMKTGDISGNIGTIYEYDTYKNPFKNVTGYNKMLQYNMYGRFANLTKVIYNTPSPAASITTISYAYNASGFPKKANFNLNGTLYTKEFFYE